MMNATQHITVSPMQWSTLPDMDRMDHDLNASDADCLADIRNVLARHGKLERFGITLMHKHFEIGDDECLVETIDVHTRTLTVRPYPKSDLAQAVQTQWGLASHDPLQWCKQQCYYTGGSHTPPHQPIPNV
jgi:hypothetical protein